MCVPHAVETVFVLFGCTAQIREGSRVVMVGIGADAVKNMVKAYITARKYLEADGIDLSRAYTNALTHCCSVVAVVHVFALIAGLID